MISIPSPLTLSKNALLKMCIHPANTINCGLSSIPRTRSANAASYFSLASLTCWGSLSPARWNPLLMRLKYSHGIPAFSALVIAYAFLRFTISLVMRDEGIWFEETASMSCIEAMLVGGLVRGGRPWGTYSLEVGAIAAGKDDYATFMCHYELRELGCYGAFIEWSRETEGIADLQLT